MNAVIESLLAGLKNPKSTVGGILTSVGILSLSLKSELAEAGFDIPLWVGVASGIGAFLFGLFSRDADKTSEESVPEKAGG